MQEDVREAVLVAVTLNMDLNNVRDGGGLGDVEAFKRDVASDVSRALELDVRSVKVLRLQAGMLQCPALGNIVDFEITPHGRCNGRDLHQALVEQAKDSRSALMSGKYTSKTLAISPPRTRAEADKENKERVRASEAGLALASPDAGVGRGVGGDGEGFLLIDDLVDTGVKEFKQNPWIFFPWDIDYRLAKPIHDGGRAGGARRVD